MTVATTEELLHAACAAGDRAAYAALADYYTERGDEDRARAVTRLAPGAVWPLRCEIETRGHFAWVLGFSSTGAASWDRNCGSGRSVADPDLTARLRDALGSIANVWRSDRYWKAMAAGRGRPRRTESWAYFGSVAQALAAVGRALATGETPT
jgi:hypothetical protein